MKHHAMRSPSRASPSAMGAANKFSHHHAAIAKAPAPRKIRIVHVLAPEVIKTDARNFRELVQRLTGKPATASSSSSTLPDPRDTAGDELGGLVADGAGAAAAIKAEAKVEETEAETASASAAGGFLHHALGEEDSNDGLSQWLENGFCADMDSISF
ncbi:nuclear speckle RNA-binding protein B-like [Oryza brachyantha]|uniref:nuclear speckle RNA-binding protein B-like n=1 Tax=Oryza brachyantha TaxID=4533 RepID=UPI001ADBCA4D|nr:nuclear speckle RNA-binding protein B-like [Oryza brachyantha]